MEYILATVDCRGPGRVPVVRPAAPGKVLRGWHDRKRNFANRVVLSGPVGADQAAGRLHGESVRRRAHLAAPPCSARSKRASTSSAASMKTASSTGPATPAACWPSAWSSILFTYLLLRVQQWLPLNPQGLGNVGHGPGLQHGGQLHHQHQLAVLHARNHHELLHPDGRAGHPQFLLGGRGHRGGHRVGARLRAPLGEDARQLLGGFHARHALHPAADLDRRRAAAVLAGRDSELRIRTPRSPRVEGAMQTIPQGPVASQEAIKMLGTNGGGFFNANSAHPFENPTPFSNFLQMFLIFLIPAGPDLHLRQDGAGHAAGLGALRRHEHPVSGRRLS